MTDPTPEQVDTFLAAVMRGFAMRYGHMTREECHQAIAKEIAGWRASPEGQKIDAERAVRHRELMERRAKIPPEELARRDRELEAWLDTGPIGPDGRRFFPWPSP